MRRHWRWCPSRSATTPRACSAADHDGQAQVGRRGHPDRVVGGREQQCRTVRTLPDASAAEWETLRAIGAALSTGYPKMPVEMAGKATEAHPSRDATSIERR